MVVMAGDHLDIGSLVDGRAQSVVVRKYFSRLRARTRLLICSGNHDLDSRNEAGEKVAHTDAGEALWFSSPGNQFTRLCDPLERPVPWLEAIPDWLRVADRPHLPGPA
jgi:hypothetical protein